MVDETPITKRCPKCEQIKPLDRFHRNRTTIDGLACYCRTCMKTYAKAWHVNKSPEKRAELAAKSRTRRSLRSDDERERENEQMRARYRWWLEQSASVGIDRAPDKLKWCCKCKRHLPPTEFFHAAGRPDGLATICKPCHASERREYRIANPEEVHAKDAARRAREGDKGREFVRRAHAKYKAKYAAQQRERYERDRDFLRQKAALHYASNPTYRERCLERAARRGREKPDEVAATKRRWAEENPEKVRVSAIRQAHTRRAMLNATGTRFSLNVWARVLAYYGHACAYCLKPQSALSRRLTVDHIHPVSRGGGNDFDNLAPACLRCNQKKGRRTPLEFLADTRPLTQTGGRPNGYE